MQYNEVEAKYSWTVDSGQNYIYWDNAKLYVDAPIINKVYYHPFKLLQWEILDQLLREALNAHNFKTTREAYEPDRECHFNDANFQHKLDASYVDPQSV